MNLKFLTLCALLAAPAIAATPSSGCLLTSPSEQQRSPHHAAGQEAEQDSGPGRGPGRGPESSGEAGQAETPAEEATPPAQDAGRFITSRKSPIELPLPEEEDAFFFMVYGDRTGGPASGVAMLRQAVAETNLIGPDLVMTVGDLIQGYNEPAQWFEQMEEYQDAMKPLRMPWFPVAGNHDIYYRSRDRSKPIPAEEHEARYEMHFGPLWYAFRHKSAWFIVLYTDEPNPDTGQRNFNDANCQRMSPEQLAWLDSTLEVTKDAPHVFVFCHHPRWIGGKYGDDWDKVHSRLVKAGNVKGVFGGHIHQMRYDPKDGIEYFALATIGGHQNGTVPEAGFLHCYDLVTVRKDRIERATLPLGAVMDPREITGRVSQEAPKLTSVEPHWLNSLALSADGAVRTTLEFTVTNPVEAAVEMEARFVGTDPRWRFVPDHLHGKLGPKGTFRGQVEVTRQGDSLDEGLTLPVMDLGFDYLTDSARFAIPRRHLHLPFDLTALPAVAQPSNERVLRLGGGADCARVASEAVALPDGPFTLEAWVHPDRIASRQGLVCKTESSEYGLFASDGELSFVVHLSGAYVEAIAEGLPLEAGRWSHLAGVFDGEEVRLYLNGRQVAATAGSGPRTLNRLDLIIGGDVSGNGSATSTLDGDIDEVRLSKVVRYEGPAFTPVRRLVEDDDTVLLMHMDAVFGPYVRGGRPLGAILEGAARLGDL